MELRNPCRLVSAGALLAILVVLGGAIPAVAAEPAPRVQVCHRPPGNPAGYHTITISASALGSHLAHSDLPGPCSTQCEAFCNDGSACTVDAGEWDSATVQCVCTHQPVNCDDGNSCTSDSCGLAVGCVNQPLAAVACDDGNACTTGDTCNATGACTGGTQVAGCCLEDADCSQGDACRPQACQDGTCVSQPVTCEAPDACTVAACDRELGCVLSTVACDDGNVCTRDSCDPTNGCASIPLSGTPCGGGTDVCFDGVCGPSGPLCGDGLTSPPEECDGTVPASITCSVVKGQEGWIGVVTCNPPESPASCRFNTNSCIPPPPGS